MPKLSLLKTSHSTTSRGTSSGRALEICAGAREIALYLGLGQQIRRWLYKGTANTAEKKRITKGRQDGWRGYRVHRELYTCFPWLFILNYRYNICLDCLRSSSCITGICLLKAFLKKICLTYFLFSGPYICFICLPDQSTRQSFYRKINCCICHSCCMLEMFGVYT